MYSDKKNILQLVALLKAHGVRKIVLCPGSRNAAIVHTLANIEDFTCYSVTDERSAGFFAIGLSLQGGGPAAVCCTSGSALLNLHPAVAEAFYQQVPPDFVISADRPRCLDRTNGRTNPAPAPCVRNVSQDVCQPCPKYILRKTNGFATALSTKPYWKPPTTQRACTYQCTHFRTHLPLHRQNTSRSTCHHTLSRTECL